jgi:hypothetical protein
MIEHQWRQARNIFYAAYFFEDESKSSLTSVNGRIRESPIVIRFNLLGEGIETIA